MADFKGFQQVTLAAFNNTSDNLKKGFMWLVRDLDENGNVKSSEIYFGTRKYADVGGAIAEEMKDAFGGLLDENGEFVGFPIQGSDDEHELLDGKDNIADLFIALEEAILANREEIAKKANQTDVDALTEQLAAISSAITEAEGSITAITVNDEEVEIVDKVAKINIDLSNLATKEEVEAAQSAADEAKAAADEAKESIAELSSAMTESDSTIEDIKSDLEKKANKDDVYTKDEVDGKISGLWHFKGSLDSADELPTEGQQNGDVYLVDGVQYAWDGEKWTEIQSNVDLSNYYTKGEVDALLVAQESALTESIAEAKQDAADAQTAADEAKVAADKAQEDVNEANETIAELVSTVSALTETIVEIQKDPVHVILGNDVEEDIIPM